MVEGPCAAAICGGRRVLGREGAYYDASAGVPLRACLACCLASVIARARSNTYSALSGGSLVVVSS